jgi:hypothetical protein
MAAWATGGSVDEYIEASPEAVYAVVSDVTSTGERSPECKAAEWLPGAAPGTVGSRFRGRNQSGKLIRWSRVCDVVTADAGREFAFRTVWQRHRPDSTTWGYRMEPEGSGTRVTQSYEITRMPPALLKALYARMLPHHTDMRPQMAETLANLKRSLESVATS